MKKSILFVATCLLVICGAFAQNSNVEINEELYKTDVEKFIHDCLYTKTEWVENFRTMSCIVDAFVVTDLKDSNKIMGGIHIQAKDASFTQYGAREIVDLGYLDVSEIDDVLTVLNDIIRESKQKHTLLYDITYISKSKLILSFHSQMNRLDISRTYHSINAFGTPTEVTYSTNDISTREIERLIIKLTDAKTKITKVIETKN